MKRCQLLNLGLVEYGKAWGVQKDLFYARSQDKIVDTLILAQHPPTYTFGRRTLIEQPVLKEGLREAAIFRVDRGGGATYHGPGQLIVYPILALKSYTTDFYTYLRMLEDVMIGVLSDFSIKSQRLTGHTGVWVDGEKIGSIGVRIVKGFTMHGLSLNVNNDLTPFDRIVPCNIKGVEMTSMSKILRTTLSIQKVEDSLIRHFANVFDMAIEEKSQKKKGGEDYEKKNFVDSSHCYPYCPNDSHQYHRSRRDDEDVTLHAGGNGQDDEGDDDEYEARYPGSFH